MASDRFFGGFIDDIDPFSGGSAAGGAKVNLGTAPPLPTGLYNLRLDPELKDICRRAGLRLSGRKSEILARIERAWANDSPSGRAAVRAVLEKPAPNSMPSNMIRLPNHAANHGNGWGWGCGTALGGGASSSGGGQSAAPNPAPKMHCWCTVRLHSTSCAPPTIKCSECGYAQHITCANVSPAEKGRTDYVCVSCRSTWLDPFSPVRERFLRF